MAAYISTNNRRSLEYEELSLDEDYGERLYPHQVQGIQWLWKMHHNPYGGALLADDMGLGKTVQVCAFLQCLFKKSLLTSVLIVCPASVLSIWENTFSNWTDIPVVVLHSVTNEEKTTIYQSLRSRFSICLTTYGMMKRNLNTLSVLWSDSNTNDGKWDYVVLDEGHKIKNRLSEMSVSVKSLFSHHRILLSGTPLQNNLTEMWTLMDWLCNGKLLGKRVQFNRFFQQPIENGRDKNASEEVIALGEEMAAELNDIIYSVTLRREKTEVFKDDRIPKISTKTEIVLWCRLNDTQINVYLHFNQSERVHRILNSNETALAALVSLQKITNHVMLLNCNERRVLEHTMKIRDSNGAEDRLPELPLNYDGIFGDEDSDLDSEDESVEMNVDEFPKKRATEELSIEEIMNSMSSSEKVKIAMMTAKEYAEFIKGKREALEQEGKKNGKKNGKKKRSRRKILNKKKLASLLHTMCLESIYKYGNKLSVIIPLIKELRSENHKVLVFGRYLKMLYIVEECLNREGFDCMHYDGSLNTTERSSVLSKFDEDDGNGILLITVGAGGEGITITAADRIILLDPNWNPTVDDQAIDRAYRIGQTKDVIVYRLVTCGTIEEKMYARQVWKECMNKLVIEKKNTLRHFDKSELKELFALSDTSHSTMRNSIEGLQLQVDLPGNKKHMEFLKTLDIDGISEHTQLFSLSHEQVNQLVRNTVSSQVQSLQIRRLLQQHAPVASSLFPDAETELEDENDTKGPFSQDTSTIRSEMNRNGIESTDQDENYDDLAHVLGYSQLPYMNPDHPNGVLLNQKKTRKRKTDREKEKAMQLGRERQVMIEREKEANRRMEIYRNSVRQKAINDPFLQVNRSTHCHPSIRSSQFVTEKTVVPSNESISTPVMVYSPAFATTNQEALMTVRNEPSAHKRKKQFEEVSGKKPKIDDIITIDDQNSDEDDSDLELLEESPYLSIVSHQKQKTHLKPKGSGRKR